MIPVVAPRRFQICRRGPGKNGIVLVVAEAEIAVAAQEAPHLAGGVTMIDAERLARRLADAADVSLPLPHGPVVLQGQPIATGSLPVSKVGVGRPPAPVARLLAGLASVAACLSDIQAQPQIKRVLLAGPERRLFTFFVLWLFVPPRLLSLFICRRAARSRTGPSMMFTGQGDRFTAQARRRFARKTRNASGDEHGSGPSSGAHGHGAAPRSTDTRQSDRRRAGDQRKFLMMTNCKRFV